MIKRFLSLVLSIMLILSACGEKPKPSEPTGATKNNEVIPDQPIDNWLEPTVPLCDRSDLELIEETVISDLCSEGYTGSFMYGSREWVIYMMERCDPFRELMFRETLQESLRHYVPWMIACYQEGWPRNVYGLTSLCAYLIPEVKEYFDYIVYSHSNNVTYTVSEEVQNAYNAYLDALTDPTSDHAMDQMHFEDDSAAKSFAESYVPAEVTMVLSWDVANEDDSTPLIYVMSAFALTKQAPEGEFLTHFMAKMDDEYRIMTDITQVPTDLRRIVSIPNYLPFDWTGFTDYELMEQTFLSNVLGSLLHSSVSYYGDELVQYVTEKCAAFRALMERDTALDSLRRDAVRLVEQYSEEMPFHADYFGRLAVALLPELEGAGEHFTTPTRMNWVAMEVYQNFTRAAMGGKVALRYMHFEDAAAEAAFAENFSAYDEVNAAWFPLSDRLYAAEVTITTKANPEGEKTTHFVGCIDDQWLVMISVDQIPAELKDGVDLSRYES